MDAAANPKGLVCPVEAGRRDCISCIMATDALRSGKRVVFGSPVQTIQAG